MPAVQLSRMGAWMVQGVRRGILWRPYEIKALSPCANVMAKYGVRDPRTLMSLMLKRGGTIAVRVPRTKREFTAVQKASRLRVATERAAGCRTTPQYHAQTFMLDETSAYRALECTARLLRAELKNIAGTLMIRECCNPAPKGYEMFAPALNGLTVKRGARQKPRQRQSTHF